MSAILIVPLGVSLELAQIWVPGRLFSATDLGANIVGSFCGAVGGRHLRSTFSGSFEVDI
jgi:VanZ family protein